MKKRRLYSNKIYLLFFVLFYLFSPYSFLFGQYSNCDDSNPGTPWDHHELTYTFINGTDDITGDGEESAFITAFNKWATIVPLSFEEVPSGGDITIEFADYDTWYSVYPVESSVKACAFSPGGNCEGSIIVNDYKYTFSTSSSPPSGEIDLYSIAIHEVGHVLGLADKYSNSSAVMYYEYSANKRNLQTDDINDIQNLYPPLEITIKNNFDGGYIYEDNQTKDSPYTSTWLEDDEIELEGYSPQTIDGYERIWHIGETNKSEWRKKNWNWTISVSK